MNIKFKNTYCVSVLNPGDCTIELELSEYNTFKEFENDLKANRIKWNKSDGYFTVNNGYDDELYFVISEKSLGYTADWHHEELEYYMRKQLSDKWSETSESVFCCEGQNLKDAFNQLKKIDGNEIELEIDVYPGMYINTEMGKYAYGKSWNKIKAICDKSSNDDKNTNTGKIKSLKDFVKDTMDKPRYADNYVDWDEVFKKF